MWNEIGAAAIYGAIGGAAGALIGYLLATPFRNTQFSRFASTILPVAFVIIGYNVAEPLLKPYIGDYLPKSERQSEFESEFDSVFGELLAVPTFAAIVEREPELRDRMQRELELATENAPSLAAAQLEAFTASYSLIQARLLYYVARATDADLIRFLQTSSALTRDLVTRDPQLCYDMNYNPAAMSAIATIDALRERIGPEWYDRQQAESAELVRNAFDKIPAYDAAAATAELNTASVAMVEFLGEENLGLISGQRVAATVEEAALACEGTAVLFEAILEQPHAVDVGRLIFVNASG